MNMTKKKFISITKYLYITTQLSALVWVTISYLIAAYATVCLGQVYPVVELSDQAIKTILGVGILKTVENIFEHNDSKIFGTTNNHSI